MATANTEKFEIRNRFTNAVQATAEITCAPDASVSVKLGLAVRWAVKAHADLVNANLAGADLARADLEGANLAGADLARADLEGAYLADADLADADLAGADLEGANLVNANLAGADLEGANLVNANLAGADLARADLEGAYLAGADLARADLEGANLVNANLAGADLEGAKNLTDDQLRPVIADYWMILSMARDAVPALIRTLCDGKVDGSIYEGECACLVGTLENAGASGLPHEPSSPAERWFASIRKGDKPGDDTAGGFAAAKALAWAEQYCRLTGIELVEAA